MPAQLDTPTCVVALLQIAGVHSAIAGAPQCAFTTAPLLDTLSSRVHPGCLKRSVQPTTFRRHQTPKTKSPPGKKRKTKPPKFHEKERGRENAAAAGWLRGQRHHCSASAWRSSSWTASVARRPTYSRAPSVNAAPRATCQGSTPLTLPSGPSSALP